MEETIEKFLKDRWSSPHVPSSHDIMTAITHYNYCKDYMKEINYLRVLNDNFEGLTHPRKWPKFI